MSSSSLGIGSILVSGSGTAYQVVSEPHRDTRWRSTGRRALRLYTQFGDGWGSTQFLPDYLIVGLLEIEVGQWYDLPGGDQAMWTWEPAKHPMPQRLVKQFRAKEDRP